MKKLITVIDLGSSKIVAAMAGIGSDGNVSILAMENVHSRGITMGDIIDVNKAVEDVSSVIHRLERHQRKKTKTVSATIKGTDIRMDLSRGMIPLSKTPREITKKDVKRCLGIGVMTRLPLNRTVVEKIVRGFYIDGGTSSVSNPVGLYGIRLEVEAFIVTANMSKIESITKCIDHAGFVLNGVFLSSVASSKSTLSENEKEKGVLLLDIGDSLTEGLIFMDSMLKNSCIIKKGARTVLDDREGLLAVFSADRDNFSSIVITGGGALRDGVIEEMEKLFNAPARIGIVKEAGRNLSSQDAIIHTSTVGLINHLADEYKNEHMYKNPIYKTFHRILDIYESYF